VSIPDASTSSSRRSRSKEFMIEHIFGAKTVRICAFTLFVAMFTGCGVHQNSAVGAHHGSEDEPRTCLVVR
jgi:hypothetical protein